MYSYYKLLDKEHNGMIVRTKGRIQHRYDTSTNSWIETRIMLNYFSDESDTYDMYEKVSEQEAIKITKGLVPYE